MVGLYQDPKGKTIFSRTDPTQSTTKFAHKKDTIESLRQQVKELKNEVSLSSNFALPNTNYTSIPAITSSTLWLNLNCFSVFAAFLLFG